MAGRARPHPARLTWAAPGRGAGPIRTTVSDVPPPKSRDIRDPPSVNDTIPTSAVRSAALFFRTWKMSGAYSFSMTVHVLPDNFEVTRMIVEDMPPLYRWSDHAVLSRTRCFMRTCVEPTPVSICVEPVACPAQERGPSCVPPRHLERAAQGRPRQARQRIVDHRIEQLDLLRERLGAQREAVEPKEWREDEVAQTLKDIHGRIEKLAAILETG